MARILVTGATGYIGGRLVPELLEAGHEVVCLARSPVKLSGRPWRDRVTVVAGDAGVSADVRAAAEGCRAAYYLVHSMDGQGAFVERDRALAIAFREAVQDAGVERVIYLGGLGDAETELSRHLSSRMEVGRILADGDVDVDELRAAVVIGSGSASFEMLRNLVDLLPVMTTPTWVRTRCQPIGVRDVLYYLVNLLETEGDGHRVLEIGGPDVLSYRELMDTYADVAGLRRRVVIPVPVLSPQLSSRWIGLVTPLPVGLAKPLVDSLVNEVVADTTAIDALLPRDCMDVVEATRVALKRVQDLAVPSSWTDAELSRPGLVARREAFGRSLYDEAGAEVAEPQPHDPHWAGGVVNSDERSVVADAPVDALFAAVTGIGGDRGWLAANLLWEVRGLIDVILGGVGTRRGRRHPDHLAVGDALDFWRVESLEPDRRLLLRAEMRVPGDAWLEFRTTPLEDGRSLLEQRARFRPIGLWGRVYWWSMVPFHGFIFPVMARRLADRAEEIALDDRTGGDPAHRPAEANDAA
jgi:uncharacterized protein YbjT (DUF2867 family)